MARTTHDPPRRLAAAVAHFVGATRAEFAGLGDSGWLRRRVVVFAKDTAGYRTIVIDTNDAQDIDWRILWCANRMARVLNAAVAATVEPGYDAGAPDIIIERRNARRVRAIRFARANEPERVTYPGGTGFRILPGGPDSDSWGSQDHDSIVMDEF